MAGISGALREDMLHWFGSIGTPTPPANFYLQWHIGDPGADGTANTTAAMAVRTQLGGTPEWEAGASSTDGEIQNSTAGQSATATGTATISYFSVWSASSGGTYHFSGALDNSRGVSSGDVLTWGVGDLLVAMT